ncbi:hypothetical protein BH24ACT3_BH24ACT3_01140 [soil metagenome]
MTDAGGRTATQPRRRSRVRSLVSALVGAVLAAAASSVSWVLVAAPSEQVNLAVGAGAVAGGLVGVAVNRARQGRTESGRSRGWRLAVAAGLLPVFAVLGALLPFFLVPAKVFVVGDYGSLVLGVLVLLAGFWVPIAVVVALVTWLAARPRPTRAF